MISIRNCRVCYSSNLLTVVDLGEQFFSGYFPSIGEDIDNLKAPLKLLECQECHLVQLKDSFQLEKMYSKDYGYRSGLNSSMTEHLQVKANKLIRFLQIDEKSKILDIGSNDGTFLKNFAHLCSNLTGIDPTISIWTNYYDFEVDLINEFFDSSVLELDLPKFDLITCIAMFYDVPDPLNFCKTVKSLLKNDGIWHVELSYLKSMIKMNSFDTICHEHLAYYSLNSIKYILDLAELQIVNIEYNDVNGGSIAIDITHFDSKFYGKVEKIDEIVLSEKKFLETMSWKLFNKSISKIKEDVLISIDSILGQGANLGGVGASTKGNVLLQFLNLTNKEIKFISEINPRKFGKVTPGTNIQIISEESSDVNNVEYKIVLPWHFKNNIVMNQNDFLKKGGKLIFPLPHLEIVAL